MFAFPIGVLLESFKLPLAESLKLASQMGIRGLQVYATYGERAPENMDAKKRKEFLDMVRGHGLTISALCGDLGKGFGNPELNPQLVEKSKRILDMAKDLETDIVTTHIGVVPEDPSHPRYRIMQDACGQLAEYAHSMDAHFAVETGPETAVTLKSFLDQFHSKGVAVNLDPANLKMVKDDDPVAAVYTLKDYIVHTHAKDGRMLYPRNPEEIYGIVQPMEPVTSPSYEEVPLGDVPFKSYLQALEDIGYHGYLTIEREVGKQPEKDIQTAVAYLTRLLSE